MLKRRAVNTVALVLLLALAGIDLYTTISHWFYALILIAWFSITIFGSFFIRWDYHLKSLHSNKNIDENWVAITFDDGPNNEYTPRILELLNKYDAKATFFCIGHHMEKYPEILLQIVSDGHSVGNHNYSHQKSFGFFPSNKVVDELQRTKAIVKDLTNKEMNLYRPAFAVTNPAIEKAVIKLGLKSIGWNIRSLDTTSRSEKRILKRITSKVSKGDIILLHDTSEKTVTVLEQLLVFLKEKNLQSVTVERLLNIKAYA